MPDNEDLRATSGPANSKGANLPTDSTRMSKDKLRKQRAQQFEILFWIAVVAGVALTVILMLLGLGAYIGFFSSGHSEGDVGLTLVTGVLALFTLMLWLAAAITARFAHREITSSSAISSAELTLQLDNRFHSDRALRIRHGAVTYLVQKRRTNLRCHENISPYSTDEPEWHGLNSDLYDLFNYFDWIGYLTAEDPVKQNPENQSRVRPKWAKKLANIKWAREMANKVTPEDISPVDRDVVQRKLGPWIINYYKLCKAEINDIQRKEPHRWQYLEPLYTDLMSRRREWYEKSGKTLPERDDLDDFLRREHVRSHRGSSGSYAPPCSLPESMRLSYD